MINATAEYALRAVVYLAGRAPGYTSREQIALETVIPSEYLVHVLMTLDDAKIIISQRGRNGGYQLVGDAAELTVYDVIAAVSALPRVDKCQLGIEEHIDLCPLHARLDEVAALVEAAYRATSIAELIPRKCKPKTGCAFPRLKR